MGYAAAKSVRRTPDSCGAHVIWARAVVSMFKDVVCHLPIRNITSLQYGLISTKEELRTKPTSTSVNIVGNSVRSRSRAFLQSKEVIKLSLINSPIDVIRSLLNISQNIIMLVMSRAFLACLENGSPVLTKSSTRVIFILQGVALFICDSTEGQHRFFVAPGTLAIPTSSQSNVFFLFASKRGLRLQFHVFQGFHE